ncbi:MAG: hypothetical protein ABUT20_56855, partial [Bacteroidota bacterium]
MKGENKTLLVFSPAFPNDEQDNWLPWLRHTVQAINKNFPQLNIVIFSFKYPAVYSTYTWNGNTVLSFGHKQKNKLATLQSRLKIWAAFRRIKKTGNIVGILSVWCGECAYLAKFCAGKTIQHYCWIVGQDARPHNKYVKKIQPQGGQLV